MRNISMKRRLLFIIVAAFVIFSLSLAFAHHYHPIYDGNTPDWEGDLPELPDPDLNPDEDGDPVYLKYGEYKLSRRNLLSRGRALDVIVERRYRTRSEYNGHFGYGWDMNYNMKVRKLKDNSKIVLLDNNNILEYTYDYDIGPNCYRAPAGHYDYLKKYGDGTTTLFKKHGVEYDFDLDGNLIAIKDRYDNSITFQYDSEGLMPVNGPSDYFIGQDYGLVAMEYQLESITDDLGREIDFTYNSDGLLSSMEDYAGRTWTYTYDPNNNLVAVTDPSTDEYPNGLTTTYTYDDNHNLLTITDPNGDTWLTNTYDENGKVEYQTSGEGTFTFSYDPDNDQTTVTDRKNFDRTVVYNSDGQPLTRTRYTEPLRAGDPASYITTYEYNADKRLSRLTLPKGNYRDYTYDDWGNVLTATLEPGPVSDDPNIIITYTYEDKFNYLKTMTDPEGNVTTYAYDHEDPNYGTTVGNLMKIIYPTVETPDGKEHPIITYTYNGIGQVETMTAPDGIVTRYVYYNNAGDLDNYGRLWKLIADYGTDPNITTEYKYDSLGNVIEITDPNGNMAQFTYNNLRKLTKFEAPSPFNYETNYSYNKNKKLSQVQRQIGGSYQTTSYAYNIMDKLETVNNPLNNITTYSYDKNENLSSVTDPNSCRTQYEYDERDLLWKVTDAEGGVTEYWYDDNGNLSKIEDAEDNATTY